MENQPSTSIGAGMSGTNSATSSATGAGTSASSAHATVDRLAQTAHETVDKLAAKAGPALERMRGTTTSLREQMRGKASEWSSMEQEWVEAARGYVREHPFTSLAIAALAGMVIARMTHHR